MCRRSRGGLRNGAMRQKIPQSETETPRDEIVFGFIESPTKGERETKQKRCNERMPPFGFRTL
ncbi:hypothetical protein F2Q69_00062336 [Brassica cretica]|uniref:Uncharacterized protein n=1 Tax=Brassica cretica TaxID=69181 RepID=A0A8S9RCJ9_BRACR|nr:hypothetical protein F2Q69_00062336 [Brassica cretica]